MATASRMVETKTAERKFKIVQAGCGVVGKAYVDAYKSKGHEVVGIEASPALIEKYKSELPMKHIKDDMSDIKGVDFVMISINTPLKGDKLDLSYLFSSVPNVAVIAQNNPGVMVILRSTVEPGTTERYKNELEAIVGKPVDVLFQPEFLRAKSAFEDGLNPWHIVLGAKEGTDVSKLLTLYSQYTEIPADDITVLSVEEAESMKIYLNNLNANIISFINQCNMLNDRINKRKGLKMDFNKICKVLTKTCESRINPSYGMTPGHAYYGTCLPKDSAELARLEQEYGLEAPLFSSVVHVNNIVKQGDKKEIVDGDNHMSHKEILRRIRMMK